MLSNYAACRLINLHIRGFYDDIYIPFAHFRTEKWDIPTVLSDNMDSLYYHDRYVRDESKARFSVVFAKYVNMINDIMNPKGNYCKMIDRYTDKTGRKWVMLTDDNPLLRILRSKKYHIISPDCIIDTFIKNYQVDKDTASDNTINDLDRLINMAEQEILMFRVVYNNLLSSFVSNESGTITFEHGDILMSQLFDIILEFTDKLVSIRVYCVHTIVNGIINEYTPLDNVTQYDPDEHDGRQIYFI